LVWSHFLRRTGVHFGGKCYSVALVNDLTERASHFAFGSNWAEFARSIDEARISQARDGLAKLVGDAVRGRSFLDIGSGSGLAALAALRLGASEVCACDLDEQSVATSRAVLTRFAEGARWRVLQRSVLALDPEIDGRFDVVYSWGVLHHTGAMWRAIDSAARLVKPGGLFVIAIYARSPFCPLWRVEKSFYRRAPAPIQAAIRFLYKSAYRIGLVVSGRNPARYVRDYAARGMSWSTDVHDWLGGYPYESATADEIVAHVEKSGFSAQQVLPARVRLGGLFGVGCGEFTFRRDAA
jgi:SAM-dependent methyltransferase